MFPFPLKWPLIREGNEAALKPIGPLQVIAAVTSSPLAAGGLMDGAGPEPGAHEPEMPRRGRGIPGLVLDWRLGHSPDRFSLSLFVFR